MECPSVGVRTVSTPEDSEETAKGVNVVSLRRGEDNEYSCGQGWGTAVGNVYV